MVTFRCKQSGNTVSFSDPADIESMRKEVEIYEEVIEDDMREEAKIEEAPAAQVKRRGRRASLK